MPMFLVDFGPSASTPEGLAGAILISVLILIPFFAYLVMLYVMQGVGLSQLAKRRGVHHAWLAWIPCGQDWLLGSLSDQYQYLTKGKVRYNRRWLLGLSIPLNILSSAVYIFFVFVIPFILSPESALPYLEDYLATASRTTVYTGISSLLNLVSIGFVVFRSLALFDLFSSTYPKYKVPLLLLSIFLDNTSQVLIFAVRDNDSGMPPRRAAIPNLPD